MYSIVLMAALTATADAPAHHNGGHGCCGYGHSCHGYYGHGCCGGYSYGCCGGYGYGCCGGYGYGWGGYYGSCYGCYGCCGGYYAGCSGCCGGGWTSPYYMVPAAPGAIVPAKPAEAAPPPKAADKPAPAPDGAAANTGRLQIDVPEDTRIFVDDRAITTPAGKRTFNTPVLDRNTAYYYIVRAETTVDGKPEVETRQVIVRAGQVSEVSFPRIVALKNGKTPELAAR